MDVIFRIGFWSKPAIRHASQLSVFWLKKKN